MQVTGPANEAKQILTRLDPARLAGLVADLLATRGHTAIKIVDGPGDGCRDIHSLAPGGYRYVSQCKWHRNVDTAVSSLEMGQLPLAMVRLGYKHGLFVTNARVSPQAKREYLDNYPGLTMDYSEGAELATEVLGHVVLRALWYDGESILRLSASLSVPMIVRDLILDKAVSPDVFSGTVRVPADARVDQLSFSDLTCTLRAVSCGTELFTPYRGPHKKTMDEGWWPPLRTTEIQLLGCVSLGDLPTILDTVAGEVLTKLSEQANRPAFAVRFGVPSITPLQGLSAGQQLQLPTRPRTVVDVAGLRVSEREWIVPSHESRWHKPINASPLMADWVRWYHSDYDACLNLTLVSEPSEHGRGVIAEQQEYWRCVWSASIFALLSRDAADELSKLGTVAPTEKFVWYDGRLMYCWVPDVGGGFRPLLLEYADESNSSPWGAFGPDEELVAAEASGIRAALKSVGAEEVPPDRARHMCALVAADPFPHSDEVEYRAVDLLLHWPDIPSPVKAGSRIFGFNVTWRLSDRLEPEWRTPANEAVNKFFVDHKHFRLERFVYDCEDTSRTYVTLYLEWQGEVDASSTDSILKLIEPALEEAVQAVTSELEACSPGAKLATGEFWASEIGLLFKSE